MATRSTDEYKNHARIFFKILASACALLLVGNFVLGPFGFRIEPVYEHWLDISLTLLVASNFIAFLESPTSKWKKRLGPLRAVLLLTPVLGGLLWMMFPKENIVESNTAGVLQVRQINDFLWGYDDFFGQRVTVVLERQFCRGLLRQRKTLLVVQPAAALEVEVINRGQAIKITNPDPRCDLKFKREFAADWKVASTLNLETIIEPHNIEDHIKTVQ